MRDPTGAGDDAPLERGAGDDRRVPPPGDLTHCVLGFVHEQVTPITKGVARTGGAHDLVASVVAETRRVVGTFDVEAV